MNANETEMERLRKGLSDGAMNPGDANERIYVYIASGKFAIDDPELARWLREEWDPRDLRQGQDAIILLEKADPGAGNPPEVPLKYAPEAEAHGDHTCDRGKIEWDARPSDMSTDYQGDVLMWAGTCGNCGLRVYETYAQNPDSLYNAPE